MNIEREIERLDGVSHNGNCPTCGRSAMHRVMAGASELKILAEFTYRLDADIYADLVRKSHPEWTVVTR